MKFALFVAERPADLSEEKTREWMSFANTARDKAAKLEGVTMLNQGTYLCSLASGLHPLSILVECAKDWDIASRTLFFDREPAFVKS